MKTVDEIIIHHIAERQKELANSILAVPAPDYAAYRGICGVYQGMQEVLDLLNQLKKEDIDG